MSPAPQQVRLLDAFDVADLDTFIGRAKTADPDGAVRLTAHGSVLLLTVRLVPGAGLLGAGGVLGLRVVGVAAPSADSADVALGAMAPGSVPGAASAVEPQADPSVDVVVSLESVSDRLARMRRTGDLDLAIPPVQVFAPWAGHAPPRTGWEALGLLDIDAVRAIAEAGIAEIATGAGGEAGGRPLAGALAVDELRRRVWTRPAPDLAGGPAGLAFGGHALGFLPREERSTPASTVRTPPVLYRHGPWWRLSTAAGHVIAR